MKKKTYLIFMLSLTYIFSTECSATQCSSTAHRQDTQQAIKWYRDSAEKNALYREIYSVGSDYINHWVKTHHPKTKTWGVVLDIDETTLDNSWYFQQCADMADNESDFEHFVTIPQKSTALPGVIELTHLVHRLGGYVSLVSNRDGSYQDTTGNALTSTIANLKQQHVYFDQVVLGNYKDSSHPTDKNPRFNAITHGRYDSKQMVWSNTLPAHQVIAYFGDNIQDFPKLKQAATYALSTTDTTFNLFSKGYFIFPNPMYGSWETNQYK